MKQVLIGIDIGTSGCKITAVEQDGRIIDEAYGEYETSHTHPDRSEQNPDDWCSVAAGLLRDLFGRGNCSPADVAAIGLDGSTHNAVLTDEDFRPLRPVIMWTDQRSVPQSTWLEQRAGNRIFELTYHRPSPTWTLPQIAWIREHEPEVLSHLSHVLFTKDYVRRWLTGTWETDHIEAQGSLLYDVRLRRWSEELCSLVGLTPRCLPPLVCPTDVVGSVTAAAARVTGLRTGTPVVAGCSDSAVEDYAAGAIEPGQMVIKMATAGNVNVMTAEPHPHAKTLTYSHVIPGLWYTAVATNTAASAERWFRDVFCGEQTVQARAQGVSVYALLDEMAAGIPPGADGLFFHPYLLGERAPYWDPNLRGSFVGVTMRHTKAHFVRALLEGVVFSLRDCFRTISEMKLPVTEMRLIGGGARSMLWSQIVSDVFRCPVSRPAGCDASFGAALLAGVGVKIFDNPADAVRRCTTIRDSFQPRPSYAETYSRRFRLYCRIHDDLAQTYAAISEGLHQEKGPACP